MLYNIRQDLVDKRTVLVNQLRGLLSERGIVIAKGITRVRKQLPLILEDAENALTPLSREVFAEQYDQLKALDEAIKDQDRRISRQCNNSALSRRFLDVPGVGRSPPRSLLPISTTARLRQQSGLCRQSGHCAQAA